MFYLTKIFLSLWVLWPLFALEKVSLFQVVNSKNYVGQKLYFTQDNERKEIYELTNLPKTAWQKSNQNVPNFGFRPNQYFYFLLPLEPLPSQGEFLLEITYPLLDIIDVWIFEDKNVISYSQYGDHSRYQNWFIFYRKFIIPITIKPEKNYEIYFRLKTTSSAQFPLRVWDYAKYFEHTKDEQLIFGIFGGILLIMAFYNLVIFVAALRDRGFIWLSLFILFGLYVNYSLSGIMYEYFFYRNPAAGELVHVLAILAYSTFALIFSYHYLDVSKFLRLAQICIFFVGLLVFFAILSFFVPHSFAMRYSAALALLSAIFLVFLGIYTLLKKQRSAYFYSLSWAFLLLGAILFIAKSFGILGANFVTNYSMLFGSALQVFVLSVGLSDKIITIRQEKEKAQAELLQTKEKMLDIFGKFVPRHFFELLQKDVMEINRGDSAKMELSVLFCDIRNFTRLTENCEPEEIFALLNDYFDIVTEAIQKHKGFIDKYIGDEIMALYQGDPPSVLRSVIEIFACLKKFRKERNLDLQIGAAIHTGELILGTLGSRDRWNSTVIGDTVNIASRLERLTKTYRVPFLVTDMVFLSLPKAQQDFKLRRLDRVIFRGKVLPNTIFEVFEVDSEETMAKKLQILPLHEEALRFYYQREFKKALALFQAIQQKLPFDYITEIFIKRCEKYIKTPPPNYWNGAIDFNRTRSQEVISPT